MPDIFVQPQNKKQQNETTTQDIKPKALVKTGNQGSFQTFSTFVINPKELEFVNQKPNESIVIFVRRHFVTNVPWIALSIILCFIPVLLLFTLQNWNISSALFPARFVLLIVVFYYMLIVGYILANFTSWFYNIGIVTSLRIIDINFVYLSQINVSATPVTEIEDVQFNQPGIFASMFDYGSIDARTVAGRDIFIFENIPHPSRCVDIISKLIGDKEE